MARATSEPRYGSSPAPSAMRPHRGSRLMSTIGLNVQLMPDADISTAAVRAAASMAGMFQVHDMPSGIGNTVSKPWITSMPISSGMPRRDFSTASCCRARIFSAPLILKVPPILPSATAASVLWSMTAPVMMSPEEGRLSCPIFSSSVIFDMRLLMKPSIFSRSAVSAGVVAVTDVADMKAAVVSTAIFFM